MKNEIKSRDVLVRFMTYLANKPVLEILEIFYKFFGKENVDCSIFYPNYKNYIKRVFESGVVAEMHYYMVSSDMVTALLARNHITRNIGEYVHSVFQKLWRKNKEDALVFLKYVVLTCKQQGVSWYESEIEKHTIEESPPVFWEPLIYVYFKKATIVLNENERVKHDIFDYFFCVPCLYGFLAAPAWSSRHNQTSIAGARTTFTIDEWMFSYVHSHRPSFSPNSPMYFKSHCTGNSSTPLNQLVKTIQDTMIQERTHSLPKQYADLFCINLRTYLGVESNQGGQYKKIEELARMSEREIFHTEYIACGQGTYSESQLNDFISDSTNYPHLVTFTEKLLELNKKYKMLKFQGVNNKIVYAMSYNDTVFAISDLITLMGVKKTNLSWFVKAAINSSSKIVKIADSVRIPNVDNYRDQYILFRGKKYNLKITKSLEETGISVITQNLFDALYKYILKYVNRELDERVKSNQ